MPEKLFRFVCAFRYCDNHRGDGGMWCGVGCTGNKMLVALSEYQKQTIELGTKKICWLPHAVNSAVVFKCVAENR